jgi:predicted TIM-barrel fold metal-dependent hydrolase
VNPGFIDYWCNAFTPDRRALWEASIAEQGIPLKVVVALGESFAEPETFAQRLADLEFGSVFLPAGPCAENAGLTDYEPFATRLEVLDRLANTHPGRFFGLFTIDPRSGAAGLREAAAALANDYFVGLQLHTHSFDRAFDHRDYYPYYALAADLEVPVVVQAGASGGRLPSECGRPIGIDRPALFFDSVDFVLSHTGWPWVDEALAMAQKHPNVRIGTAGHKPQHWPDELVRFAAGRGQGKVLFGTSFPVVSHGPALDAIQKLGLSDDARSQLLEGAARAIFR